MAINKPMEIAFADIKHILIDIVVVECHCHMWSLNVPNTDKTPGDFSIWCARKKRCCRCEYIGGKSAAFCVFGPLRVCQTYRYILLYILTAVLSSLLS